MEKETTGKNHWFEMLVNFQSNVAHKWWVLKFFRVLLGLSGERHLFSGELSAYRISVKILRSTP